jgi:hypothetical protein
VNTNDIREELAEIISDTYEDDYGYPSCRTFHYCAAAILERFLVVPRDQVTVGRPGKQAAAMPDIATPDKYIRQRAIDLLVRAIDSDGAAEIAVDALIADGMTEIPTLLEVLEKHRLVWPADVPNALGCDGPLVGCNCGSVVGERDTDHFLHVAEAYQEARTIRTPDEADELAIGAAINDQGLAAVKVESGSFRYTTGEYWEPGLPVLVVWTPRDGEL